MGKKQSRGQPGGAARPPKNAMYAHIGAVANIYVEANGTYQFQPGSPLRDMSCLTCGLPAGGQPVQLSFLSWQGLCDMSTGHGPAVMFLRHKACLNPDDTTIRDAIAMALRPCYDVTAPPRGAGWGHG